MKKWISCFLIAGILAGIAEPRLVYSAQQQEPAYAKWSRIAIQEVKRKYPDVKLLDYKHIGREKVNDELAAEKFKLWVRQGSREFGVYVTVEFNVKNEKIQSIQLKESDR